MNLVMALNIFVCVLQHWASLHFWPVQECAFTLSVDQGKNSVTSTQGKGYAYNNRDEADVLGLGLIVKSLIC